MTQEHYNEPKLDSYLAQKPRDYICYPGQSGRMSSFPNNVGTLHQNRSMDSSIQPELRIFNATLGARDRKPIFHVFPPLTTEPRPKIWEHACTFDSACFEFNYDSFDRIKEANSKLPLQTTTSNQSEQCATTPPFAYIVVVERTRSLSKFMPVNQEARIEALRFYQVNILWRLMSHPYDIGQQTV